MLSIDEGLVLTINGFLSLPLWIPRLWRIWTSGPMGGRNLARGAILGVFAACVAILALTLRNLADPVVQYNGVYQWLFLVVGLVALAVVRGVLRLSGIDVLEQGLVQRNAAALWIFFGVLYAGAALVWIPGPGAAKL